MNNKTYQDAISSIVSIHGPISFSELETRTHDKLNREFPQFHKAERPFFYDYFKTALVSLVKTSKITEHQHNKEKVYEL